MCCGNGKAEGAVPRWNSWPRNAREWSRTSVISIGELAASFPSSQAAWEYFRYWRVLPLHRGVVDAAADVDRELIRTGERLGENDNWIAGFGRFYREPIISLDAAFDRVRGLRRVGY